MNAHVITPAKVQAAIDAYKESGGTDINAGWNILRYARMGALIEVNPYALLRLAKAGELNAVDLEDA